MRGLVLMLMVLCGVATAGTWQSMMSPGPVHQSHDEFAGDCDSCHLVFEGVPDAKCLDCHTGLATKIAQDKGYHATLEQPCIDCHTDHLGLEAELTEEEAVEAFSHDLTGFTLHGKHEKVKCATCHEGSIEEMAQTCGTCHDDTHSSALGPECEACHVAEGWQRQLKTLDAHLLSMEGKHGDQGCADCHTHGENLALDTPCVNCHDQAHDGTTAPCEQCHEVTGFSPAEFNHGPCTCAFPGKHQTVGCLECHEDFAFSDTPHTCAGCHTGDRPHDDLGACSQCHTAVSWSENTFDHNRQAAFALDGAHLEVSCAQCHSDTRNFGVEGVDVAGTISSFKGNSTDCAGCHKAQGDEVHGDFGACETCHTTEGFAPSTFDHASTGFPLTGTHTDLGCPDCHEDKVAGYPE